MISFQLRWLVLGAAVALLAGPQPAPAACRPEDQSILAGGSIHATWVGVSNFPTTGSERLLAAGDTGIVSLDATAPDRLEALGFARTGDVVRDMVVAADVLYAAAQDSGLLVFSNATSGLAPKAIANVPLTGYSIALAVDGSVVYVAAGAGGLAVIDVTSPASPQLLGQLPVADRVLDVELTNSLALVAAGNEGLVVLDRTLPAAPVVVGQLPLPGFAASLAQANGIVWIAEGTNLTAINVSNPLLPTYLASVPLPGSGTDVLLRGSVAWVAIGDAGVAIIDISFPNAPYLIGYLDTPGLAFELACSASTSTCALADLAAGVATLDGGSPTSPYLRGRYRGPVVANSARGFQGILASAIDGEGVFLADITDPEQPVVLSSTSVAGRTFDVLPLGNRAIVANRERGIQVLDVGDPSAPHLLGETMPPGEPTRLARAGDRIYVASGSGGLVVVEIRDPTATRVLAATGTGGAARDVALVGRLALVAAGRGGVRVYDVGGADQPLFLGSYVPPSGDVLAVTAEEGLAVASIANDGLVAISLADPAAPAVLGRVSSSVDLVSVSGAWPEVFAVDALARLWVYDFEDPSHPTSRGTLLIEGAGAMVTLDGERALIAAGAGGIHVVDVFSCLSSVPKPVPSFRHDPEVVCAGGVVQFEDTSAGKPFAWYWDFGDGGVSTESAPAHVFETPGFYDVSLFVTNQSGTTSVVRSIEAIDIPPVPEAFAPAADVIDLSPFDLEFAWSSARHATDYALRLFGDDSCRSKLIEFFPIDGTSYSVGSVPPGAFLWWNVSAVNSCGESGRSPCRRLGVAPIADFDAATEPACLAQLTTFRDRSRGNVDAWRWDFGDGGTADGFTTNHIFRRLGSHRVSLAVSGPTGDDVVQHDIEVTHVPEPAFAIGVTPVPVGEPVQFLDASQRDPSSWIWSFGDGEIAFERDPVHVYSTAGDYSVSLTAINSCGAAAVTQSVPVGLVPRARFDWSPAWPCRGESVRFSDRTVEQPSARTWTFGDGVVVQGGPNPLHTYAAPGLYLASLDAENAWGESNRSESVQVFEAPAPEIAGPATVTIGIEAELVAADRGSRHYLWQFGDGSVADGRVVKHAFGSSAAGAIRLTVDNRCGASAAEATISVQSATPPAAAIGSPLEVPRGAPTRLIDRSAGTVTGRRWTIDGGTETVADPIVAFRDLGDAAIELDATGPAGNSHAATTLTVRLPVPRPDLDFLFVPTGPRVGDTVRFLALGDVAGRAIEWRADDGWSATGAVASHIFGTAGAFTVELEIDGHVVRRALTVTSPASPLDFDFTPPDAHTDDLISFRALGATGVTRWRWDFGDGSGAEGATTTHVYSRGDRYVVRLEASTDDGRRYDVAREVSVRGEGESPTRRQTLTGVASLPAQAGGRWSTDVVLANPTAADASFAWRYVDRSGAAEDWQSAVLGPFSSVAGSDLVASRFNLADDHSGRLEIESRTDLSDSLLVDGRATVGAYGQGLTPQVPADRALIFGLVENATWRSRVGVVNHEDRQLEVDLILRGSEGLELMRRHVALTPRAEEWRRLAGWFDGFGGGEDLALELVTDGGLATLNASRSHTASGDGELLAPSPAVAIATIAGSLRQDLGGGRARFTDLVLHNPNPHGLTLAVEWSSERGPETLSVALGPRETRRIRDALGAGWLGLSEAAGVLRIRSSRPEDLFLVHALRRTDRGESGVILDELPVIRSFIDGDALDRRGFAAGLRQGPWRGRDWNTVVRLIADATPAVVDLRVRGAQGQILRERTDVVVPAFELLELDDLLPDGGDDVSLELVVEQGAVAGWCEVSGPHQDDLAVVPFE